MKKVLFGSLLALMAALLFVPAVAGDDDGEKKISVHGEVRARWEYSENFTDFRDSDGSSYRDSFDFMPYRVRVGVKGEFAKNVSAYVEIQNHGAFGDSFPLPVEQGVEDPALQSLRTNFGTNETVLYQGYIDLDEAIPDGAVVIQAVLHTLVGFTGGANTTATINIGDNAGQSHADFNILDLLDTVGKAEHLELLARIPPRPGHLLYDIVQGWQPDSVGNVAV